MGCGKEPLPLKRSSWLLLRWHIAFDVVRGRRCSPSRFVDVLMILFVFDISIIQNSDLCQLKSLLMREATALLPLLEAVIFSTLTPPYVRFWMPLD